jgi:hypothetical protein
LKEGGLAYQIDFSAADPDLYAPPVPYPEHFGYPNPVDGDLIIGRGDGDSKIDFAKFNDGASNVKIESLMPEDLYLGQIVPFEFEITCTERESPEDGAIQIVAGWSTIKTSGGDFGYNATIGVLSAFIDTGDGAHSDQGEDATVNLVEWTIVDFEIQGVFNITGLDSGDTVVLEVWVVVDSIWPSAGATGNVHSRLITATTSTGDSINTGTQTVPMMPLASSAPEDGSEARFGIASAVDVEALCE